MERPVLLAFLSFFLFYRFQRISLNVWLSHFRLYKSQTKHFVQGGRYSGFVGNTTNKRLIEYGRRVEVRFMRFFHSFKHVTLACILSSFIFYFIFFVPSFIFALLWNYEFTRYLSFNLCYYAKVARNQCAVHLWTFPRVGHIIGSKVRIFQKNLQRSAYAIQSVLFSHMCVSGRSKPCKLYNVYL